MNSPLESTISNPNSIRIKRIKAGSLFNFLITACFTAFVPLFLLAGILALFGGHVVWVNNESVIGINGLLVALVMIPVFSLVFSILLWLLIYPGMVIRSLFGPITIKYHPINRRFTPPLPVT
jgi:hypothetical protein